jgi:alkylhydroperoxidase family enzyme
LYCLSTWREVPFYTDRERAALAWTESVTELSKNQIPEDVYQNARAQFSDKELVDLTMAVIAINGMNWLAVSSNTPVGSYKRGTTAATPKAPEPSSR